MKQHWPLLAFLSFVGGMLAISRVGHWVVMLAAILKRPAQSDKSVQWGSVIAPIFLHSGPWALTIAVGAILFAAKSSRTDYWSVVGGIAAALGVVGLSLALSLVRERRAPSKRQPLTPERLLVIRRLFFWIVSLSWAIAPSVIAYVALDMPRSQREVFAVFMVLPALAGGWLFSWFMWQYYGEVLKRNEKLRQMRELNDGV